MGVRHCLYALVIAALCTLPAVAQDIGSVAPRTEQVTLFNNTPCADAAAGVVVPDIGQNSHFVLFTTTNVTGQGLLEIQFSADGTNYFTTTQFFGINGLAYASGWTPKVRVHFIGSGAGCTITAYYTGTWGVYPFFGSNFVPGLPLVCNATNEINFTGSGTHQIIASTSGTKSVHLCKISLAGTASADITITSGTGSNCATNPVTLSGTYKSILSYADVWDNATTPFFALPGKDICITNTAGDWGGQVFFAQ